MSLNHLPSSDASSCDGHQSHGATGGVLTQQRQLTEGRLGILCTRKGGLDGQTTNLKCADLRQFAASRKMSMCHIRLFSVRSRGCLGRFDCVVCASPRSAGHANTESGHTGFRLLKRSSSGILWSGMCGWGLGVGFGLPHRDAQQKAISRNVLHAHTTHSHEPGGVDQY